MNTSDSQEYIEIVLEKIVSVIRGNPGLIRVPRAVREKYRPYHSQRAGRPPVRKGILIMLLLAISLFLVFGTDNPTQIIPIIVLIVIVIIAIKVLRLGYDKAAELVDWYTFEIDETKIRGSQEDEINAKKARELLKNPDFLKNICGSLTSLANDIQVVSNKLVPVLISTHLTGVLNLHMTPPLAAWICIIVVRMGINGVCAEFVQVNR